MKYVYKSSLVDITNSFQNIIHFLNFYLFINSSKLRYTLLRYFLVISILATLIKK